MFIVAELRFNKQVVFLGIETSHKYHTFSAPTYCFYDKKRLT